VYDRLAAAQRCARDKNQPQFRQTADFHVKQEDPQVRPAGMVSLCVPRHSTPTRRITRSPVLHSTNPACLPACLRRTLPRALARRHACTATS
jgi:hypothetical protein